MNGRLNRLWLSNVCIIKEHTHVDEAILATVAEVREGHLLAGVRGVLHLALVGRRGARLRLDTQA